MKVVFVLVMILGLGLLMVIHEGGHYLAARWFGMRVIKFSLGMPPVLARFQPKGSPTTFQIGAIPFFAYVQIAGLNPLEEIDKNDKGSYANASLIGRIVTIFAGSLANYLVASVFFFGSLMITGEPHATTQVTVMPDQPAAQAGMRDNDRVLEVDGTKVDSWEHFRTLIGKRPSLATPVLVQRGDEKLTLTITPSPSGEGGQGRIGAKTVEASTPIPVGAAVKQAVLLPPLVVANVVVGLARVVTLKQKAELGGPVAIVTEGSKAAEQGPGELLRFLGLLSASLAAFNLLPFPALDGGRLVFLGYEALSRRRPDAMIEAHVHVVGFFMLLALMLVVSWRDIGSFFGRQ
jgi:regulator of sigma E protease